LKYTIYYSEEVDGHLRALTPRQRSIALDAVRDRLPFEPTVETRNRKPLRENPLAPWELRVGNLRVYYKVEESPKPIVYVLAIGVKERDQVRVGGEAITL